MHFTSTHHSLLSSKLLLLLLLLSLLLLLLLLLLSQSSLLSTICLPKMGGSYLEFPGASTMDSSQLTPFQNNNNFITVVMFEVNPCNAAMSFHFRHLSQQYMHEEFQFPLLDNVHCVTESEHQVSNGSLIGLFSPFILSLVT